MLETHSQNQEKLLANIQSEMESSRAILDALRVTHKRPLTRQHGIRNPFYRLANGAGKPKEEKFSNRQVFNFTMNGDIFLAEIINGCHALSDKRNGGLIIIEKRVPLIDYIQTGVYMDCIVSSSCFSGNRNYFGGL